MRMDRTSTASDLLEATKKITFQRSGLRNSQLVLRWYDPQTISMAPLNTVWRLVTSGDVVNGIDVLPDFTPPLETNPPPNVMTINPDGDKWNIKYKRTA